MHFNLKLFISTFILIFLAELGDKTQLAAMAKSIEGRFTVFVAASLALICSTLIAVLFGEALTRIIPERVLQIASALLFLFFGSLMLFNVFREGRAPEEAVACEEPGLFERIIAGTAIAFEEAAEADYMRLAEQSEDEGLRKVLTLLAADERDHARRLRTICGSQASEEPPVDDSGLPSLEELIHDAADEKGMPFIEHALEHELATARFYEQLASTATVPGVKHVLQALAAEEYGHAETLKALKKA